MAQTQRTIKPLTIEDLHVIGFNAAEAFLKADVMASKTKRQTLLKLAKHHAGDEKQISAILDGYADGFAKAGMTDGTVRARKAEAKAVFDAIAKSGVTGDILKQLEAFDGHYNEFITLARDLRNDKANNGTGQNPPERIKTKLTVRQYDSVENNLKSADANQLEMIAEQAVVNISKNTAPELAGLQSFRLIRATCTQIINNKQIEKPFRDAASKIDAMAGEIIERAQKAAEIASKAGQTTAPVVETETEETK